MPVSVIVCTRNAERFLARALDSVFAQTHRDFEVLLIDGASTDDTLRIAAGYPEVVVHQQPGGGISDAYNHGIQLARHDLLAFLSADDQWTQLKLETQCAYLESHPEVEYTLAHVRYRVEPGSGIPPGFRPELLEGDHPGTMETLVARRRAFDRVGLFDTRFATAEDLDWFARARDRGVLSLTLPDVLLIKSVHRANLSLTTGSNNQSILNLLHESMHRKRGQA